MLVVRHRRHARCDVLRDLDRAVSASPVAGARVEGDVEVRHVGQHLRRRDPREETYRRALRAQSLDGGACAADQPQLGLRDVRVDLVPELEEVVDVQDSPMAAAIARGQQPRGDVAEDERVLPAIRRADRRDPLRRDGCQVGALRDDLDGCRDARLPEERGGLIPGDHAGADVRA